MKVESNHQKNQTSIEQQWEKCLSVTRGKPQIDFLKTRDPISVCHKTI